MKRTLLFTVMLAGFVGIASAQTINGIKLVELKEPYLEIRAFKQEFGSKNARTARVWPKVVNDRQASLVKDYNGKNMEFNSALDFINKMKIYGYELFNAYAVTYRDDTIHKFYILKRKD
ncbi:hypothetical protein [Pedobacter sp. SL55]|uniref:hypothetical protein n=1 Tax=Pedobacter sp. SL55 TaxID=2995161 RepID=UPI002270E775|nr:hypothetical protein [Pedobacter sp. SL55]WAC41474.1 hypothetical protein OVA16_03660 [Pedobacter sp. SL55]